jgi:hypothetical protein
VITAPRSASPSDGVLTFARLCAYSECGSVFFAERERRRAIAVVASAAMLAYPVGPLLGGWLLTHFWWGSVFLLNLSRRPRPRSTADRAPAAVGTGRTGAHGMSGNRGEAGAPGVSGTGGETGSPWGERHRW